MRRLLIVLLGLATAALLGACDSRDPIAVPTPQPPSPTVTGGATNFVTFVTGLINEKTREDNEPDSIEGRLFSDTADPGVFSDLFQ